MTKKIRRGVFETNSSSVHAVCISNEEEYILPVCVVRFKYGHFGWEHSILTTVEEKASYLYSCLYYVFDVDNKLWEKYVKFICETLKEHNVEVEFDDNIIVGIHIYGNNNVYIDYECNGSVDHGFEKRDFVDAVCTDKDKLMRYLFCDKSIVVTGNDNGEEDYPVITQDMKENCEVITLWN